MVFMAILPIVALDVDGVLAPLEDPDMGPPACWPPEDWQRATDRGNFGLAVARPVVAFLKAIHEQGRAEVVWHTSWMERAPQWLAPDLGLPEWPVLATREEHRSGGWWKASSIERLLSSGRSVIWLDDDIDYSEEEGDLDAFKGHPKLFTLCPEVMRGLEAEHLQLIDAKLKEWGH